jgi:hypothetical protein
MIVEDISIETKMEKIAEIIRDELCLTEPLKVSHRLSSQHRVITVTIKDFYFVVFSSHFLNKAAHRISAEVGKCEVDNIIVSVTRDGKMDFTVYLD